MKRRAGVEVAYARARVRCVYVQVYNRQPQDVSAYAREEQADKQADDLEVFCRSSRGSLDDAPSLGLELNHGRRDRHVKCPIPLSSLLPSRAGNTAPGMDALSLLGTPGVTGHWTGRWRGQKRRAR